METQRPEAFRPDTIADPASRNAEGEFLPGSILVYGLHGKCKVIGLETREIGGQPVRFYKLEVQKSALSRSTRQSPAIWIPVERAREQGLRELLHGEESTRAVFEILQSREYYFEPTLPWHDLQSKLETSIRLEGAVGLAKTLSLLHVLKKKQVVPTPDVGRMYDSVSKQLIRELSEATSLSAREIEAKINKSLRHKMLPDQ